MFSDSFHSLSSPSFLPLSCRFVPSRNPAGVWARPLTLQARLGQRKGPEMEGIVGRGGLERGALPLQSQTGLTPTTVGPPCPPACSTAFPGEEPQALSLKLLTIKMRSGWSSPSRGRMDRMARQSTTGQSTVRWEWWPLRRKQQGPAWRLEHSGYVLRSVVSK